MSDLSKLFSVFSLPGKINTLISTVDGLLNNGPMQAIAAVDSTFKTFLADVTADTAELKSDASKFNWHNIGEWLSDFEKLCKDATAIGIQVVSLYEGLTVDPDVAGSLGVVLTIVKDIASLLSAVGINIPTPALSPAATKAVIGSVPTTTTSTETPAVGSATATSSTIEPEPAAPVGELPVDWNDTSSNPGGPLI